jgi:GNAT superfamily N-acetyltransferase
LIEVLMKEPSLVGGENEIILRLSSLDDIVDLRHRILRAGLPRETAIFQGDDAPSTLHFGGFVKGRNVACASYHLNHWQGRPAWQLRGMATSEDVRGKGVGKALLIFAEEALLGHSPLRLFWANARTPARAFYQKLGWVATGDEFVIPTAGPHFKMYKEIKA